MTRIAVLGGTGYAGTHIIREAAQRGHEVVSWSRSVPAEQVEGVTYRTGDFLDEATLASALDSVDVVIGALSPRGALDGHLRDVYAALASAARSAKIRIGIVGGAGSLLTHEGGSALVDLPDFPEDYRPEARQLADVLADLRAGDNELDWFFVSPAANFGGENPGEARGTYRLGGDVLLVDDNGVSDISGADFAHAIIDEVESPSHRRARFTVAY